MGNENETPYIGLWHCQYTYPSLDGLREERGEYYMESYPRGDELVLESLPNKEESHIVVRLSIHRSIAKGNWEEKTSPYGMFKGSNYSGAVLLVVDEDERQMEGKWVGVGHDSSGKPFTHSGRWEMRRIKAVPAEAELYHLAAAA